MYRSPISTTLCILFFISVIRVTSALSLPQSFPRQARNGASGFNNGKPQRVGLPDNPTGSLFTNGPYGIDTKAGIPFSRANRGSLLFYGKGEGNTPDGVTDQWV